MKTDLADYAVLQAEKLGCEYAEARLEENSSNAFILKNNTPQVSGFGESHGMGIRFLNDKRTGFVSLTDLSRRNIRDQLKDAISGAKAMGDDSVLLQFPPSRAVTHRYSIKQKKKFSEISPEEKIRRLLDIQKAVSKSRARLLSSFYELSDIVTRKYIVTSDGVKIESEIPRLSFFYMLTLKEGNKTSQRYSEFANVGGFELFDSWKLDQAVTNEAVAIQNNLRYGKKSPKEKMDIVVGPEISGIIAHESCGHPMEADRILGRELAQAGGSFIKKDMLGKRIGSDKVTVIDDPTIKDSYGHYLYDDEGVKARPKELYKNGIINEFLHNKETASIMGVKSNGSARASSFDREPLLRMSNTFIKPGDYSEEELFEGIKLGVYMKNFTEWNIDDNRFQQKYVGADCWLIENGELTRPVSSPSLEITTPQLYSSVDACADNLELHPGNCGKGEPMQGIPVTLGGPSIRLRGIRLN